MTESGSWTRVLRRAAACGLFATCLPGTTAVGARSHDDRLVMPGIVSTGAAEVRIAYRPDGKQILWGSIGRDAARDQQDIWEIHRTAAGWSAPARVAFDTEAVEFDPAFSPDGRQLYFDSDRAGGFGGTDIYVAEAIGFGFSVPRNVGSSINSKGDEWAATPTGSGTLIFASDGRGGFGKHDLFEGKAGEGSPRNLGPLINGPDEDFDAALSPDGRTLVFSSGRMSDSAAEVSLFTSRRGRQDWTPRSPLRLGCSGFKIGAAFARRYPRRLFYSAACAGGPGRMDIREVAFRPSRR